MFARFIAARRGATSIEYATVAGLISIVIVVGATGIGSKLKALFLGPILGGLQ